MLKQPLFGEDSSPHITSMLISSIVTLICWIIFCVMCFVIQFKPKTPEYKEVQIVLSSTPVVEKESSTEEAAASIEESVVLEPEPAITEQPVVVEQSVVAEPVEAPKPKTQPAKPKETPKTQTQPAKPATTPAPKTTDPSKKVDFDNMTYATDYSDFSFNNSSTSSSKSTFDWSQFDDSDTEEVQVSKTVDKVTNSSSISGSSASTSTAKTTASSSSSTSTSSTKTPAASSSTNDAANTIKNATGTSTSSTNTSTSTSSQKFSSDLDITWNGGVTRKQIGSLSIDLKESGSDIKEKKTTVTIEFTVDEKGYTIAGTIKITPESLLPEKVRKEVISEISKWRFIEGPSRSVATFEYTIEKR